MNVVLLVGRDLIVLKLSKTTQGYPPNLLDKLFGGWWWFPVYSRKKEGNYPLYHTLRIPVSVPDSALSVAYTETG